MPPYLLRHSARPAARFSSICSNDGGASSSDSEDEGCTGTSEAVRDRGRDRALIGRALLGSRGVVAVTGDEATDEAGEVLLVVVLGIV